MRDGPELTAAVGRPGFVERLGVAAGAALFLRLVLFRGSALIFPFASGSNGVFLDEGYRVLGGEVMYRDFFEFLMPGTTYLYAAVFAWLGPTTAALGQALLFQGALLALLMHALAARVVGPGWRLLPPAAFVILVHAPYTLGDHKWPALAFGLAGLLAICGGPLSGPRALAGGLLLGASVTFTQDLGLGLAAGVLASVALGKPGAWKLLTLACGCLAAPLLALAVFARQAGLATVLHDCIVFPLTRYRELNEFGVALHTSLRTWPRELAQLVLATAGLWGAVGGLRSGESGARLAAAAGLGMLLATAHRGLFPAVLAVQSALLLPLAARELEGRAPGGARAWLGRTATVVVALGLIHGSVGFVAWRQRFQPLTLEAHRAGTVWVATPLPELTWIERNTAAGDPVFLLPARGGHYFLSHTRNLTSFPYLIEGQSSAEQAAAALAQIAAARPGVGLWDERPGGAAPPAGRALRPLREALLRDYEAERLANGVLTLRRRGAPGGSGVRRGSPASEPAPRDEGAGVVEQEADPAPGVVEQPELAPQLHGARHVLPAAVILHAGQHGRVEEETCGRGEQPTSQRRAYVAVGLGQQTEQLPQRPVQRSHRAPGARPRRGRGEAIGRRLQQQPQVHVANQWHGELVDRQRERVIGEGVGVLEPEHAGARPSDGDTSRPHGPVVDPVAHALHEAVVDLHDDLAQAQHALVVGRQPRSGAGWFEQRQAGVYQAPADEVDAVARDEQIEVLHGPQRGPGVQPTSVVGAFEQHDGLVRQLVQEAGHRAFEDLRTPLVEPRQGAMRGERAPHDFGKPLLLEEQRQQAFALGLQDQPRRRRLVRGRPALAASQAVHQGPEGEGKAQAHRRVQSTTADARARPGRLRVRD